MGAVINLLDRERMRRLLERHEGRRRRLYADSEGIPTIGIGHNLREPISDRAIDQIFEDDLLVAEKTLSQIFGPYWRTLDQVRMCALADLAFNLGEDRLSLFVKFIAAVKAGDWDRAAMELRLSAWWHQVGTRAPRVARMIKTGEDPGD